MGARFATVHFRRSVLAGLVVAICIGCTEPEPVATTLPATTTTVSEPPSVFVEATSGPIQVESEDKLRAVELVASEERLYLFAEDRGARQVVVWSSADGATWADHGSPFTAGSRLAGATDGEGRVLAVTVGPSGGNPSLWSTSNGDDWDVEEILIDHPNELMQYDIAAVGVNGPITVLSGFQHLAAEELIESRIKEMLWPGFDATRHGLNVQPLSDDIKIDVLSPLGLRLISTTAAELGLFSQQQEWIRAGMQSFIWETWLGLGDGSWTPTFVEGANFVSSLASAEGTLFAVGHNESGAQVMWSSPDGIVWDRVATDLVPGEIRGWGSRLVATNENRGPDLWTSDDALSWEPVGISEFLPPGDRWFIYSFDAIEGGIAASFGAFDIGTSQKNQTVELPQIEKDGVRVVAQEYGILLMYEGADEEDEYLWSSSVNYGPDKLMFDSEMEVVHFYRDDGSELVSLTLDDFDTLSEMFFSGSNTIGSYSQRLLFSADGETWTVWDLEDLDKEIEPWLVSVIGPNVVVVGRDRSAQTGFGIWVAETG